MWGFFCYRLLYLPWRLFSSEKLFLWVRDLFFASGAYGTGERKVIKKRFYKQLNKFGKKRSFIFDFAACKCSGNFIF
jgi:hypothetical protein